MVTYRFPPWKVYNIVRYAKVIVTGQTIMYQAVLKYASDGRIVEVSCGKRIIKIYRVVTK